MNSTKPLFAQLTADDEALAREIADLVEIDLPKECVAGVAANARLLQHHADILRRSAS